MGASQQSFALLTTRFYAMNTKIAKWQTRTGTNTRHPAARFDSSVARGNLADAMKNAVVLFPPPQMLPITRLVKFEAKEGEQENYA